MAKGGHPTDYRDEFAGLARNYALLGATREEIAGFLGVTRRTVLNWCKAHPEFKAALEEGARHADAKVTGRLYENCLAGDTTAIIWWQKNRMGWRDRVDTIARVGVSPVDELLSELEGTTFKPRES